MWCRDGTQLPGFVLELILAALVGFVILSAVIGVFFFLLYGLTLFLVGFVRFLMPRHRRH